MKLYYISQSVVYGYDTYSDAVVCAPDKKTARNIHPSGIPSDKYYASTWCEPERVQVKYLGEATKGIKPGVICASFHGG